MARLNFQQPLLQSSVSHDPIEIILIILYVNLVLKKRFSLLSMLETVVLLNSFVETMKHFSGLFSGLSLDCLKI